MTKEHCIALAPQALRNRAVQMVQSGFEPDFVYMYLKNKAIKALSGIPPITFKSKGGYLRNYQIYGNIGGVGDLVESGEHTGEYAIPVVVGGKNVLQNTATSQTKNDIVFTVNEDSSVVCNGEADTLTVITLYRGLDIPDGNYIMTGCPTNGSANTYYLQIYRPTSPTSGAANDFGTGASFSFENHTGNAAVNLCIAAGYNCENLTFYPMIRSTEIEDTSFEPYRAPLVANIYLSEPLGKTSETADYINYKTQKRYDSDGSINSVELPNISTIQGTNILNVATTVQPSKVSIRYKR